MFGKMMNRYYYGKSGKGDFTSEDLPQNRWQLFWEMLRIRFSALIRLNLMYMLCWLPAIFVIGRALVLMVNSLSMSEVVNNVPMLTLETETVTLLEFWGSVLWQTLLLLIPCVAITGPFTAGLAYVTRNWSRDEHAFVWSDFKDAVKGNWKYALITSIITGLMPAVVYMGITFYRGMAAGTNWIWYVPCAFLVVISIIWFSMLIYMYPLMVTYDLKYKDVFRNALLLTIGRLPMTVGLRLLSLVPALLCALLCFLLTQYMQIVLMVYAVYYIVIGFALGRFVSVSYANAVFDRYINSRIEGAEVNRGLAKDEDEEEQTEEQ